MTATRPDAAPSGAGPSSQPRLHQRGVVIQEFGTVKLFPLGLSYDARMFGCEQFELAERVQTLGGVSVGDPRHVAELTAVPRPPDGVEEVPAMLSRLLEAHETVLVRSHDAAAHAAGLGDDGSSDLLVSQVIRTGELQAWFLAEHLVETTVVRA